MCKEGEYVGLGSSGVVCVRAEWTVLNTLKKDGIEKQVWEKKIKKKGGGGAESRGRFLKKVEGWNPFMNYVLLWLKILKVIICTFPGNKYIPLFLRQVSSLFCAQSRPKNAHVE